MGNTLGTLLQITTFGESHSAAIGGIISGFPSGFAPDMKKLRQRMEERRPGSSPLVTSRNEKDEVEILSGIFKGKTLGTPIGFIIRNNDARPVDYAEMEDTFRSGHADYAYHLKYGLRDHRGGGRASARTTAPIVFAGALCGELLEEMGIRVNVELTQAGKASGKENIEKEIENCLKSGDSCGGIVSGKISGLPSGIGEPIFGKLQSALSQAIMSINAVKGFEYGLGFSSGEMYGSEITDKYIFSDGKLRSAHNYDGGISGGISTGEEIMFKVAFKPTPTTLLNSRLYDEQGNVSARHRQGRHDPCVALRGQYIVKALCEFILLDQILMSRAYSKLRDEYLV